MTLNQQEVFRYIAINLRDNSQYIPTFVYPYLDMYIPIQKFLLFNNYSICKYV